MTKKTVEPIIEWKSTDRGFTVGRFQDRYLQGCSIQESSLATEAAIWLGVDDSLWSPDYDNTVPTTRDGSVYKHINARMHLTRDMAAELWPLLKAFAKHGQLPAPSKEENDG